MENKRASRSLKGGGKNSIGKGNQFIIQRKI